MEQLNGDMILSSLFSAASICNSMDLLSNQPYTDVNFMYIKTSKGAHYITLPGILKKDPIVKKAECRGVGVEVKFGANSKQGPLPRVAKRS